MYRREESKTRLCVCARSAKGEGGKGWRVQKAVLDLIREDSVHSQTYLYLLV